jgi:hypothetical protein
MVDATWISVKQALTMLQNAGIGYASPAYFRTKFLELGHEILPIAPQPPGDRKRRRLRILRAAIEALISKSA